MANIILQQKESETGMAIDLTVTNSGISIQTTLPVSEGEDPVVKTLTLTPQDFPSSDKDWQAYLIKSDLTKPIAFNALTLGDKSTRQEYTEKNGIQPLLVILAPYAISKVGLDSLTYLVRGSKDELFACNQSHSVGSPDTNE
ncbi:hypothetical protein, partial [Acinetobacter baylyi]|uniref:hypothetical protein n=1 Tax=Acinetobacter baylyi TaxID=202950 RepID=UPI0013D32445